ncbi:DUF202 domain-containing protein [Pseudomonas vranovensis]|uniref:DUF202 domain-containing protein n=1 Tax=Pseudomonas vranovensis TaxID=321661 RepID=A0A423CZQ2_9PSED|nr:DUF202 domain-containing protein [Pseudomonas vranovensis]ROL64781.1 hypothetical protein BHU25_23185 [Pseudomonas vranovensis]
MSDAGLQAERTSLAWRRTQILLVLVACLALRGLQHRPGLQAWVITIAALLALAVLFEQRRCYRRARLAMAGRGNTCEPLPLVILTLCSALLAVLSLLAHA